MLLSGGSALAQGSLVELGFSEFNGTATTNSGSPGGTGSFVQADGPPIFTNRVPVGAFVPANNLSSVDFGDIAAGQGGRAIDFTVQTGDGSLGSLAAFTVCGWLNARNLNEGFGGNRIAFALASPDGPGFDLVQTSGALRIDQGPGAATVNVPAVAHRTYTVQFSDSLGSGEWRRLGDVVAVPDNRVVRFTDPGWNTKRFYRVVVPAQP